MSRTPPVRESSVVLSTDLVSRALCRLEELPAVLDELVDAMNGCDYPEGDVFKMRLAMLEAAANALKHGHGYDEKLTVLVRYHVGADEVIAEVEDEGPGFDPDDVADPLDPENIERPCGRGLFLIRHCTTWVRHEGRGNRVVFGRRRSLA